jgi:hypothetical protein
MITVETYSPEKSRKALLDYVMHLVKDTPERTIDTKT